VNWLAAIRERYQVVSDPQRTERRIELAGVVLALLLVLQLVRGAIRLTLLSAPNALPPTEDALRVMAAAEVTTVTAEQSNEIRQRPLLWAERRPVEVVAVVEEPTKASQQQLKEIKLLGVFGEGDSVGIIAQLKDKTLRIHLGEEVSGWTLESVGTNEAVFAQGKRRETLELYPSPPDDKPGKAKQKAKVSMNRDNKHKQYKQ
jgi:hypothetical protein